MTMKINIEISVTDEGYTDLEAGVVAALASTPGSQAVRTVGATVTAPATAAPAAAAEPAEETTAPAKRTRRSKAQIAADEAAAKEAAAPAEDDEDDEPLEPAPVPDATVDQDDADDEPGMVTAADAVNKATELLAAGQSAKVKAALAAAGAKRVSELKGAAIAAFVAALEA